MGSNIRIAVAAAAIALALVGQLQAQQGPDVRLAAEALRAVNGYERFTIFDDIHVSATDGIVTLTGKVTARAKKEELASRVAAVAGALGVRNEIGVLPASSSDDEIRHRMARAIYGNAAFWRYAALPNPPIHILVEEGRVTLTGWVRSDSDRALARSLAAGQGEVSLTCALRTEVR